MKNKFKTPIIVISKCLNFGSCRFNGEKVTDDFLLKLGNYVEYIKVCPEVAIGLGIPRSPVRLYDNKGEIRMYQLDNDIDLTDKFNHFSKEYLNTIEKVDGFVLKNRSPSCGVKGVKVYDKKDTHSFSKKKSFGLFSENIVNIFPNFPIEDEGTIKNFRIREDYLTKIFLLAEFRSVISDNKINDLVKFHTKHKYLFMSYSQTLLNQLGKIVASYNKKNIEEVLLKYTKTLYLLISKNRIKSNIINTFVHIFGYFKKTNSAKEKGFFLQNIQVYKEDRIPMSSIFFILKAWAIRDNNEYLLNQSIFNPFPEELIDLNQSGKYIDI